MGRNLARNLARHGHVVASAQPDLPEDEGPGRPLLRRGHLRRRRVGAGVRRLPRAPAPDRADGARRAPPTDAVIDEFIPLLEQGDVIIDAGNAHFLDTRRREKALSEKGLNFVGMGVSGGEEGALNGPSIMPGGPKEAYDALRPAARGHRGEGRRRALLHPHRRRRRGPLREDGPQRHRVRRHAAHRRGLRPAAQGRWASTRRRSPRPSGRGTPGASTPTSWRSPPRCSRTSTPTTGKPFVDVVADEAEQKGTGRWTVQGALDLGVPVTGIAEAVFARSLSGAPRRCATPPATCPARRARCSRARRPRASPTTSSRRSTPRRSSPTPRASTRSRPAPPSTTGRSTWARSPRSGAAAASSGPASSTRSPPPTARDPELPTLLTDTSFREALAGAQDSWRRVVAVAAQLGIPAPGFSTALAYYDALRAERLPAALDPGPAGLLRRPHLPAHRPRGHVPHPLGRGGAAAGAALTPTEEPA